MAITGVIAARTRAIIPITWDALLNDTRFGEALLRSTIDVVKERITGENIAYANEGTYALVVVDYLAKLSALELINPGIDFWMSQPISATTTGTAETIDYPARTTELRNLRISLLSEVRKIEPQVLPLIGYQRLSRAPRASINTQNDDFLTPSPQEFPRPFKTTGFS